MTPSSHHSFGTTLRMAGLATLAGAASVLEQPVLTLGSACVLYVLLCHATTVRSAMSLGGLHGLALHGLGHSWVYDAMTHQARTGTFWALFGTAIFVVYLSLFTAVPAGLFGWFLQRATRTPPQPPRSALNACAGFAALLTAGEYSRSLLFNGFTTLSAGYSWVDGPLGQGWIPIVGVYGASWLIFFCAATAGSWLSRVSQRSGATLWAMSWLVVGLGALAGLWVSWTEPHGAALSFRLLQLNTELDDKFDLQQQRRLTQDHLDAITRAPADLIVTPETAFTLPMKQWQPEDWKYLRDFSQRQHSHLLLGVVSTDSQGQAYNSMLMITPSGQSGRYDKIRLMPFGEYSPAGFGWFMDRLSIPLKDLSPGAGSAPPLPMVRDQSLGWMICHEDSVGSSLASWLPQATVLINPSNLAWFDGTRAIIQRTRLAQARALEAGRPILRISNSGITAHINPQGRIVAQLPATTHAVLSGQVQGMSGQTPYARLGNGTTAGLILLGLLFLMWPQNTGTGQLRHRFHP